MQLPMELQQAPQGMPLVADDVPRTPVFTPACNPAQHLFARSAGMLLTSLVVLTHCWCSHRCCSFIKQPIQMCMSVSDPAVGVTCCVMALSGRLHGLISLECFRLLEQGLLNRW
jgi:hypothetical protein